ncbi:hypothetical protein [Amycolatopsis sp. GA6-003]|uniref:hypothetical protein n=1 Tax=Amycolatopsis sp. GA6-003 TaxID=2652444 RepID=UPI0039173F7F
MVFDLTRLGSERFEHLVQALSLDRIGPGTQVFGVGPDGGREATFDGEVHLGGGRAWSGYGVIQAKYRSRLTSTSDDQKWFFEQVTAELDEWVNPKSRRRRRQPKYFVIATNVRLTAVAESGGIDRLDKLIARYRDMKDEQNRPIGLPGLEDYALWHAQYLDRLLETTSGNIRRAYADLILPGDVLSRLFDSLADQENRIAEAWIDNLARSTTADADVGLGGPGGGENTPLALADDACELSAASDPHDPATTTALAAVIDRSDQILQPDLRRKASDRRGGLEHPSPGLTGATLYITEHLGHAYSISVDNERNSLRRDWEVVQEHIDEDGKPVKDRQRGSRAFPSRSAQLGFVRRRLAALSRSGANWTCTGPQIPDDGWPAGRPPRLRAGG